MTIATRAFGDTRPFTYAVMILMLMGLAFWNDISRNWTRVIDWLTEGL